MKQVLLMIAVVMLVGCQTTFLGSLYSPGGKPYPGSWIPLIGGPPNYVDGRQIQAYGQCLVWEERERILNPQPGYLKYDFRPVAERLDAIGKPSELYYRHIVGVTAYELDGGYGYGDRKLYEWVKYHYLDDSYKSPVIMDSQTFKFLKGVPGMLSRP